VKPFEDFLGLGIAGNFALHLDQAGEAEDFKDIITEDEAAPKGIFPFYLPCEKKTKTLRPKDILFTYPLSSTTIALPQEAVNVQAEPEVGLICEIAYDDAGQVNAISPKAFAAYNDCSIREAGREKISDKKNWGKDSKGIAAQSIAMDSFAEGGIMDAYAICSFLKRDGELHAYGEDVALTGYSYFYDKLTEWIVKQINTQKDFGPLEDIQGYIAACSYPTKLIISIGATRYTAYGEHTFLQNGDEVYVVLYNKETNSLDDVIDILTHNKTAPQSMSILAQKVI